DPKTPEEAYRLADRFDRIVYGAKSTTFLTQNYNQYSSMSNTSYGEPMQIDTLKPRRFKPKDIQRLRVQGLCFNCQKPGHIAVNLEVRLGYIGTGLHNKLEVPEAKTLLEVNGQINGKVARILLDTGCSTYVLSTQFATRHNIEKTPMKLRSVDLAVSGVGAQLAYKTGLTKIRIGNTEVEKSLYLLPIQQFDAIV